MSHCIEESPIKSSKWNDVPEEVSNAPESLSSGITVSPIARSTEEPPFSTSYTNESIGITEDLSNNDTKISEQGDQRRVAKDKKKVKINESAKASMPALQARSRLSRSLRSLWIIVGKSKTDDEDLKDDDDSKMTL